MKPEDLKSPFTWDQRKIIVQDRVWYIPSHYDQYDSFTFPGWVHADLFSEPLPIKVEYCSGNGAWIAAKAKEDPQANWVAVERKFERVRKIWSKIKNHTLRNLLAVCGEAYTATHYCFPSNSVAEVFINFPDPWPKNRHAKHRLIQLRFIEEIYRILHKGGTLTLVTDDLDYSVQMIATMQQHPHFESVFTAPYFTTEWPGYGTSYFEDLWRQKGKKIHYHQFRKKGE